MKLIGCDRCGKVTPEGSPDKGWRALHLTSPAQVFSGPEDQAIYHLCGHCVDKLVVEFALDVFDWVEVKEFTDD